MSASTSRPDAASDGAVDADAALPAEPAGPVVAAVLVPLFLAEASDEPHLVLTRRRADLRSHAGEISFPGGRSDTDDSDLTATALREAEEEIGLARAYVSLLATLPPTSTFVTNYMIHPFVGMIPAGLAWTLSVMEVDAVLELPLDAVRAGRTRTRMERRGISFETDTYVVAEHLIWGATARIIENLLERIDADPALGALRSSGHRPAA